MTCISSVFLSHFFGIFDDGRSLDSKFPEVVSIGFVQKNLSSVQIHWPVTEPQKEGDTIDPPIEETWAAMEELCQEVRRVSVCNYKKRRKRTAFSQHIGGKQGNFPGNMVTLLSAHM